MLTISENGYARTAVRVPITNRGGKGIVAGGQRAQWAVWWRRSRSRTATRIMLVTDMARRSVCRWAVAINGPYQAAAGSQGA